MTLILMEKKQPKLKKRVSKQLGFTDSTIKRYRDDFNMDSPYNRKKFKKKNTKLHTLITETQTNTSNKNTESKKKH